MAWCYKTCAGQGGTALRPGSPYGLEGGSSLTVQIKGYFHCSSCHAPKGGAWGFV